MHFGQQHKSGISNPILFIWGGRTYVTRTRTSLFATRHEHTPKDEVEAVYSTTIAISSIQNRQMDSGTPCFQAVEDGLINLPACGGTCGHVCWWSVVLPALDLPVLGTPLTLVKVVKVRMNEGQ
jgi:hypothetical protein